MSTSLFYQQKYSVLAAVHVFSEMTICLVFFGKVKKVMWNLVLHIDEFLDAYSQLGLFNSVTDEVTV